MEYLLFLAGIAGLLYFSYSAGKDNSKAKYNKELVNVIQKARKDRHRLNDPEYVDRLLMEHK